MFELSIRGDFAAAHFLRGYEGKCKNLHGHTWKVELIVTGETLDKIGMVCDFAILKQQLRELLSEMDHAHLNELPYFKDVNPTTENLAKYIFEEFPKRHRQTVLKRVTVWESENAGVSYTK